MRIVFKPTLESNNVSPCKYCDKLFITKEHLINHIKKCSEYNNKPVPNSKELFKCEYCIKTFTRNSTL